MLAISIKMLYNVFVRLKFVPYEHRRFQMNIKMSNEEKRIKGKDFIIDFVRYRAVEKVGKYWFLLPVKEDGSLGESVDGCMMTAEELEDADA